MGSVLINNFISILAVCKDLHSTIFDGALFHSRMASLIQVFCAKTDLPISHGRPASEKMLTERQE